MSLVLAGAITIAAVILFVSGRLRIDLVSLLVLVTLGATRLVTPAEAISGFANPATVTVLAMLILAGGLEVAAGKQAPHASADGGGRAPRPRRSAGAPGGR